jgi:hypothetical protein
MGIDKRQIGSRVLWTHVTLLRAEWRLDDPTNLPDCRGPTVLCVVRCCVSLHRAGVASRLLSHIMAWQSHGMEGNGRPAERDGKNCFELQHLCIHVTPNEPQSSCWSSRCCKQSNSQRRSEALFAPAVDKRRASVIRHFQAKNRRHDWSHHKSSIIPTV